MDAIEGLLVQDILPPELSCSWTCSATPGSTCTPGPALGDIVDVVDVVAGGVLTYSAACDIDEEATGTIENSATITLPAL